MAPGGGTAGPWIPSVTLDGLLAASPGGARRGLRSTECVRSREPGIQTPIEARAGGPYWIRIRGEKVEPGTVFSLLSGMTLGEDARMTEDDLRRIETTLDIRPPDSYRSAMLAFPVPALVGNRDHTIWDDADAIIEFNQELRSGTSGAVEPWPPHMFALGHVYDASACAIDLRSPDGAVWWVDHCHLTGAGSFEEHASFDGWLTNCVADLRHDCEADGIDPDGTPESREAVEEINARSGCRGFVYLVVALVLIAALIVVTATWQVP